MTFSRYGSWPCRISCRWWLNTLFKKSWNKSLMIGCNLEWFANSPPKLEHGTLYFDNLVDKNGTLSMIFQGIFLLHCEYMRVQNGRVMVSLSWNLCVQGKKIKGLWRANVQECQPCPHININLPHYLPIISKRHEWFLFNSFQDMTSSICLDAGPCLQFFC